MDSLDFHVERSFRRVVSINPYLPYHKFQEITKLTSEHLFEVHSIEKRWNDKWIKVLRQRLKENVKVVTKLQVATKNGNRMSVHLTKIYCVPSMCQPVCVPGLCHKTEWKANCGRMEKDLVWLGFPAKIGSMTNQQGSKAAPLSAEESIKSFLSPSTSICKCLLFC